MQIIEQEKDEILSLFNDRMYTNPNGVIIYLDSCDVVTLALDYPYYYKDNEYTSLSYWKEFPSIDIFEKNLIIKTRRNLDNINYKFIKRQFEHGKIDMSCYVEINGLGLTLFFRQQGSQYFARENESLEMCKVKRSKITPADFVNYTVEIASRRNKISLSGMDR